MGFVKGLVLEILDFFLSGVVVWLVLYNFSLLVDFDEHLNVIPYYFLVNDFPISFLLNLSQDPLQKELVHIMIGTEKLLLEYLVANNHYRLLLFLNHVFLLHVEKDILNLVNSCLHLLPGFLYFYMEIHWVFYFTIWT